MENRSFGTRCGYSVAPVSIGGMRFPPDAVEATALVRHAIDRGMCYIDTSRGYGESEFIVGRALQEGYRDRVALSTKCSPWIKKVTDDDNGTAESVRHRIEESMLRLGVDTLDFYQVWNINNRDAWETATRGGGMVDGIRQAMADGLVRHTGFTAHDSVENLLEYLPQADWCEVLLLSYNLLSTRYAPVIEAAHRLGIGTIVMNPVGGGKLAEDSTVLGELAADVGAVSVADLALRFVISNPNVDTMLCGMSKLTDVDDTVASVERGPFDDKTFRRINAFIESRSRTNVGFCTACKYCMPCPAGIRIPEVLGAVYDERFLGLKQAGHAAYQRATRDIGPDACTNCGRCEEKCTQGLKVRRELRYALERFGETRP